MADSCLLYRWDGVHFCQTGSYCLSSGLVHKFFTIFSILLVDHLIRCFVEAFFE